MKRSYSLLLFLASLIFLSCNNSTQSKYDGSANQRKDSTATNNIKKDSINSGLQKLLLHFKDTAGFPFITDSAYIAHATIHHDSLGAREVNLLSKNLLKDSLMDGISNDIHEFDTIDSLKAHKLYSKWVTKLDIGMIENTNAYGLHKLKLNDSTTMLIWSLECDSYPADPNFSFTYILETILDKNEIGQTFILGRALHGTDPPVSDDQDLYSYLYKNGSLTLDYSETYYDSDSAITTLSKTHFEYLITNKNIKQQKKEYYKPERIK